MAPKQMMQGAFRATVAEGGQIGLILQPGVVPGVVIVQPPQQPDVMVVPKKASQDGLVRFRNKLAKEVNLATAAGTLDVLFGPHGSQQVEGRLTMLSRPMSR